MSSWDGVLGAGSVMRDVSIGLGFDGELPGRDMRRGFGIEIGGRRRARGVTNNWRKRLSMRQAVAGGLGHARAQGYLSSCCAESPPGVTAFYPQCWFFLPRSARYNSYH